MVTTTTLVSIGAGSLLLFITSIFDSLIGVHFERLYQEHNDLLESTISMFSIMPSVGNVIGPIVFCFIADVIGRKYSMAIISLPLIFAFGIFEFTINYTMWCIANFLCGLCAAALFTVFPIYISEITEKSSRGKLISIPYISVPLGNILLHTILNENFSRGTESIVNFFCITLSIFAGFLLANFSTETPSYYVKKGMDNAANATLTKISNGRVEFKLEAKDLRENNIEHTQLTGKRIMPFLMSNGILKAAAIVLSVNVFVLLSGMTFNGIYTTFQLQETSLNNKFFGYVVSVPSVIVLSVSIILVDIIGRKLCLMVSFGGTAIFLTLFIVLSAVKIKDTLNIGPPVLAALMVLVNVSYYFGGAQIPSIFLAELFPLQKRMLASAVLGAIIFGLKILFVYVMSFGGNDLWLYINVVSCAVAIIVVKLVYLETKQKSLNQIQLELNR